MRRFLTSMLARASAAPLNGGGAPIRASAPVPRPVPAALRSRAARAASLSASAPPDAEKEEAATVQPPNSTFPPLASVRARTVLTLLSVTAPRVAPPPLASAPHDAKLALFRSLYAPPPLGPGARPRRPGGEGRAGPVLRGLWPVDPAPDRGSLSVHHDPHPRHLPFRPSARGVRHSARVWRAVEAGRGACAAQQVHHDGEAAGWSAPRRVPTIPTLWHHRRLPLPRDGRFRWSRPGRLPGRGRAVPGVRCAAARQARRHARARATTHTVEAVSLAHPDSASPAWVGVNQLAANRYVEALARAGGLPGLFARGASIEREVWVGASARLDFVVGGRDVVEVKSPLDVLPLDGDTGNPVLLAAAAKRARGAGAAFARLPRTRRAALYERSARHAGALTDHLCAERVKDRRAAREAREVVDRHNAASPPPARAALVQCFQWDAPPVRALVAPPPSAPASDGRAAVVAAMEAASAAGVETWQVNLTLDPRGVTLVAAFPLDLFPGGAGVRRRGPAAARCIEDAAAAQAAVLADAAAESDGEAAFG